MKRKHRTRTKKLPSSLRSGDLARIQGGSLNYWNECLESYDESTCSGAANMINQSYDSN